MFVRLILTSTSRSSSENLLLKLTTERVQIASFSIRTSTRTAEPIAKTYDDDERTDDTFRTADNEHRPNMQSPDDAFRSRQEQHASLQLGW